MSDSLNGKKILVLVANGVDEAVMSNVQRALLKTGAAVKTSGMESGLVNSWNNNTWGLYFPVDLPIGQTLGSDYDMLVVPSGSRHVQKLSTTPHTERILASFLATGKPVALMGDSVALLEKTGHGALQGQPNIFTCDTANAEQACAAMLETLAAAPAEIQVAA